MREFSLIGCSVLDVWTDTFLRRAELNWNEPSYIFEISGFIYLPTLDKVSGKP